jgi:hypothetical protein
MGIRPWNWFCFVLGIGMFLGAVSGSVEGATLWLFLVGGPLIIAANVVDVFGKREKRGYSARAKELGRKIYMVAAPVMLGLVIAVWQDSGKSVDILLYSLVLIGGLLGLGYWMMCRELDGR